MMCFVTSKAANATRLGLPSQCLSFVSSASSTLFVDRRCDFVRTQHNLVWFAAGVIVHEFDRTPPPSAGAPAATTRQSLPLRYSSTSAKQWPSGLPISSISSNRVGAHFVPVAMCDHTQVTRVPTLDGTPIPLEDVGPPRANVPFRVIGRRDPRVPDFGRSGLARDRRTAPCPRALSCEGVSPQ